MSILGRRVLCVRERVWDDRDSERKRTDPSLTRDAEAAGRMPSVEDWKVERVFAVAPSPGSDCDAAYLLTVSYGVEQAAIVVEFAAPSSVASAGYAEEVVRRYLSDDEPPQRLVVARDGTVAIAAGPLPVVRTPRNEHSPRQPGRGRRRGNR